MKKSSILPLLSIAALLILGVFIFSQLKKDTPMPPKPIKTSNSDALVKVPGKIVFQSDRSGSASEIWVLENGQMKKIADGGSLAETTPEGLKPLEGMLGGGFGKFREPRWSPDGKSILCETNEEDQDPPVLALEGSIRYRIKTKKSAESVVWSPDGKSVYYAAVDKNPSGGGADNIYRHDIESGNEVRITDRESMLGMNRIILFRISSDGKRIAIDEGGAISVVNADGTGLKRILDYAHDPAWSPDGNYIVFASRHYRGGREFADGLQICLYDVRTGKDWPISPNKWHNRYPVFSPDGKQIVFSSHRHHFPFTGAELFVMNLDGTGEARLTPAQRDKRYPINHPRAWATDEFADWIA